MTTTTGLALLRVPFAPHHISKLPKPYKKDSPKGNCPECGGYHGLPAMHLDYVGHAALTDRLLDTDPAWTWEPVALGEDGLPKLDANGGLWIRLTVCGVTRLGYGDADGKTGPAAMKERIGDALRNAAMRFGAALDLWHKGDLHADSGPTGIDGNTGEVLYSGMSPDILADWLIYINDSDKAGTLKTRLAEAIKAAMEVNDSRAVDQMQAAADAKAATAKAKATAGATQ